MYGYRGKRDKPMKRLQAWQYLIVVFAVFWILFATILIIGDFPFFVISMALTTLAGLSVGVIALAWAYTHDW
jgi:hypothetical protein